MASACAPSASHSADPAGVRVRGLRASYRAGLRRRQALHGVDLHAPPGSVTAVVGPNGAGKTTLFRVLLGFLRPDGGEVTLDGLPPALHRRSRGTGYLPERSTLPAGWTVSGLLRRGLRMSGSGAATPDGPDDLIDRYGLAGRDRDRVESLSRGLSRRLALAFALLGAPGVVLLDEPLAGLDPPGRSALETDIVELGRKGVTVILASHDLHAVRRMADRAAVLVNGHMLRVEEASSLRAPGGIGRLRALLAAPEEVG